MWCDQTLVHFRNAVHADRCSWRRCAHLYERRAPRVRADRQCRPGAAAPPALPAPLQFSARPRQGRQAAPSGYLLEHPSEGGDNVLGEQLDVDLANILENGIDEVQARQFEVRLEKAGANNM